MSDRFPAEITIGGKIPRLILWDIAKLIVDEGLGASWEGEIYEGGLEIDLVLTMFERAAERCETLTFSDLDARGGEFPSVENFLIKEKIDFDRHSEGKYSESAELIICRDGRHRWFPSDQEGRLLIEATQVREILDKKITPKEKLARIDAMITIPTLAPITLIGEAPEVQP